MERDFGKYDLVEKDVLNIHFDTPDEQKRACEILEGMGIRIPARHKDGSSFRTWPESTHVLHVELKNRAFVYSPQPFICAAMVSNGARLYTVAELEMMAELDFRVNPRFPIFHVPHGGNMFPHELMTDVCVPEEVFMAYHAKMRDTGVREMVPRPYVGQMLEVFQISRLLCDVERFIGPDEVMERYGMGFCYERAYDGTVIKNVTDRTKAKTMEYYQKHQDRMDWLCQRHPRVLLIDMHSYSDEIVPKDFLRKDQTTPDVCIGTDARYTPPELTRIVSNRVTEAGFTAAINDPYCGTFVPDAVLRGSSDCDCVSIMLEFNKRAYCAPDGLPLPDRLECIQKMIRQILADCVALPHT